MHLVQFIEDSQQPQHKKRTQKEARCQQKKEMPKKRDSFNRIQTITKRIQQRTNKIPCKYIFLPRLKLDMSSVYLGHEGTSKQVKNIATDAAASSICFPDHNLRHQTSYKVKRVLQKSRPPTRGKIPPQKVLLSSCNNHNDCYCYN